MELIATIKVGDLIGEVYSMDKVYVSYISKNEYPGKSVLVTELMSTSLSSSVDMVIKYITENHNNNLVI